MGKEFFKDRGKVRGVSDSNLIRREVYNRGECEIVFILMNEKIEYIRLSGITPGFSRLVCKPGEFVILNHAFYIAHTKDGRPAQVIENRGDMIGKRNTKPSNPFLEPDVR